MLQSVWQKASKSTHMRKSKKKEDIGRQTDQNDITEEFMMVAIQIPLYFDYLY